jgi:hypothetical protein
MDEEHPTQRIPSNEGNEEHEDGIEVEDESEDKAEDENENELEAKDDDDDMMMKRSWMTMKSSMKKDLQSCQSRRLDSTATVHRLKLKYSLYSFWDSYACMQWHLDRICKVGCSMILHLSSL